MIEVFADSYFYLALANPEDTAHARALAALKDVQGTHVTHSWVLSEVAGGLSSPANRPKFLQLLAFLKSNSRVVLLPPTQQLFDAGVELFSRRPDKDWSLVDCISFHVMTLRGIRMALTGDKDFEQAGFQAVLRKS
ncbi:MAG: PIN domain-containing protein [Planctomycetota bacterium]